MKTYVSLLSLITLSFLYAIHTIGSEHQLPPYAIQLSETSIIIADLIQQPNILKETVHHGKRTLFINNQEVLCIDSTHLRSNTKLLNQAPTKKTHLELICDLYRYGLVLCVIDPASYNSEKNTFDTKTELAIKRLANSTIKTHYFINAWDQQQDPSPLINRIGDIYIHADNQKVKKNQECKNNSPRQQAFFSRFLKILYSRMSHICSKLTHPRVLIVLYQLASPPPHIKFPFPQWQVVIQNSIVLFSTFCCYFK